MKTIKLSHLLKDSRLSLPKPFIVVVDYDKCGLDEFKAASCCALVVKKLRKHKHQVEIKRMTHKYIHIQVS